MSEEKRRILVTGGRGYLAELLIERLLDDPSVDAIVDIDPKNKYFRVDGKVTHLNLSILDCPLTKLLCYFKTDTVVHAAWDFNPRHDRKEQYELDVEGTRKVFCSALESGVVKNFIYLGSTTAYGQFPRKTGEKPLTEEEWGWWWENPLIDDAYQYSLDKAVVDKDFQFWSRLHGNPMNIFWIRGAIVLGPNIPLENVVSKMARTFGPFMFRARGYDPPMQFVSEWDITRILFWAIIEKWSGVVNVAGDGVVRYSEIIRLLGKKEIVLPAWLLKTVCAALWKLRLIDFPPEILKLIMYPWVGDILKLRHKFGYKTKHSSTSAVLQLKEALNKKRGG